MKIGQEKCRQCEMKEIITLSIPDIGNKLNVIEHVKEQPRAMGYDLVTNGSVATGIVLFLIVIFTVTSNICVLTAVFSNKKLKTRSNLFIVSLSLTDLLVGTIVMVPAALNEIFKEWILAEGFCSIWVSFDVMLTSASILNVCLISIDRYIAIMTPLRYKALITTKRAFLMFGAAWGIAILSSFVPIENGLHNTEIPSLENLTMFSDRPRCTFIVSFPYAVIASTITILLPIIVAISLYYRVSKEAKRQAFLVGSLITPGNVLLGQHVAAKHIREPFTRKATVTLGIIVAAFVVTWAPFLFSNSLDAYCRCIPPKVFQAFVWLGYCNSLINPIIYPLFMRDFRKVYMDFLSKCCPYIQKIKALRKNSDIYNDIPIR